MRSRASDGFAKMGQGSFAQITSFRKIVKFESQRWKNTTSKKATLCLLGVCGNEIAPQTLESYNK